MFIRRINLTNSILISKNFSLISSDFVFVKNFLSMNKDTKSLKLEIWKWKISLVACSSLIFVQQIYITCSHICHLEEKIHNLEYCLSRTPLSHQRRLRELEEQVALVVAHTNLSEHRVSCACCIQTFYLS